jgi:NADPH:quinone reductase-like Zn-dependent oxidoreductase
MSSFAASRDRLKPGGAYVTTVPEPSIFLFAPALAAARLFGPSKRAKFLWARSEGSDLAFLGCLAEKGKLKPEIARIFPLEQAREAHDLSEQGHVRGKIVLT